MTDLLPCPFCTSKSIEIEIIQNDCAWVECPACLSRGPEETTPERAAEAWNAHTFSLATKTESALRRFLIDALDALEAIDGEIVLTGHLKELTDCALAARNADIPTPAQGCVMREALERIAKQQLVEERLVEGGDYEYGYEQIVKIARAALAAQPPAAPVETGDDPTANPAWNDGCDFAMTQLCIFLGVNQNDVRWDAATETVDGDVQAVIGNILRAKFGEDWGPEDHAQCSAETAQVRFGFASFKGGKFELIVINIKTGEEVLLEGQLRPDQTIEQIDKVLPTCVYVTGEPQTAPLPVEAIRAAVTLLARKITKLSWSRDECRRKGQDVYVANLTAQIDQLDGYYHALSSLALSRPQSQSEG